ncbi:hypothetical protein ACKTMV_003316 [Enterobacter hormaechei]
MQNERIFYMDKAVDLFNSLREEKVSERVDNAHLGAMGAVNVQVWTSVLGGTLQYETSNGGCTLRVIHTDPVLEGNIPFEQWLSQQTGTIDVECGCVMTEVFFHWLRVAYEAGNSPVIPDGVCPCCGRKQLKNRTCSVSGCDEKHVARGFCKKHYDIERKKDPSRRESIRSADKRYRARKAAAPQQEVK